MKNSYRNLRITLPESTDLADEAIGLTDFAIYSAPKPQQFGPRRTLAYREINVVGGKRYAVGDVWTRRVSSLVSDMMLTRECDTGLTFASEIDATDVGVVPQIQNPAAEQLGSITIADQKFLTDGTSVATHPATAVKARLAKQLTTALLDNNPELVTKGFLALPSTSAVQSACVYQYNGRNYVYAKSKSQNSQWFNCEPIRIKECANGNLQCLDVLYVTPFADYSEYAAKQDAVAPNGVIDTDQFLFRRYLQFHFRQNLKLLRLPVATITAQLSETHKLRRLLNTFTQAAKKRYVPERER